MNTVTGFISQISAPLSQFLANASVSVTPLFLSSKKTTSPLCTKGLLAMGVLNIGGTTSCLKYFGIFTHNLGPW